MKEKQEIKAIIITVLNNYNREMEGYSYFGSNMGVPEDDFEEVADSILEKINEE
jgi:hypothetical protein